MDGVKFSRASDVPPKSRALNTIHWRKERNKGHIGLYTRVALLSTVTRKNVGLCKWANLQRLHWGCRIWVNPDRDFLRERSGDWHDPGLGVGWRADYGWRRETNKEKRDQQSQQGIEHGRSSMEKACRSKGRFLADTRTLLRLRLRSCYTLQAAGSQPFLGFLNCGS